MKITLTAALCMLLFTVPTVAQNSQQTFTSRQASDSAKQAQTTPSGHALTLEDVVRLAVEHSPQLALARVRYTVAKNTAGVDRAEFRPNLYTGSGAAYTNGFPETPGGAAPSIFQMSYNQEIFDLQKRGDLHADEELAKNQRLEYENTRETVIMQAATAYLELAEVQRSLQLLQSAHDSSQQIVKLAQQREAAGLELPVNVTQDQLQVAKLAQQILQYQGREEKLTQQLRDLTGIPASEPLQISTQEIPASESVEPASNVVSDAISHSASIREAENLRQAREDQLKGAKGAYWPTVTIIGEYAVLSDINNYSDYFRKFQRNNVTAGVSVTIPIFASRTSANVALARSNFNEANLELTATKRAVQEGAEGKVRTLNEADAAKEVARLDLQLAQEQLENTQSEFNQGHATLAQLEQAHVLENQKFLAFLDADLARQTAQLDLLKTTGQLAQVFHQ